MAAPNLPTGSNPQHVPSVSAAQASPGKSAICHGTNHAMSDGVSDHHLAFGYTLALFHLLIHMQLISPYVLVC